MLIVNHASLQRRHHPPHDTNQRQPDPRAEFLQDKIPRDFQRDVTDEEQRQAIEIIRSVGAQAKIGFEAFETGVRDVCTIQE